MFNFRSDDAFVVREDEMIVAPYENSAETAEAIPVYEDNDDSSGDEDPSFSDGDSSDSDVIEGGRVYSEEDPSFSDSDSSDGDLDEVSEAYSGDKGLFHLSDEEPRRTLGRDLFTGRNPRISETEVDDGEVATAAFCDA